MAIDVIVSYKIKTTGSMATIRSKYVGEDDLYLYLECGPVKWSLITSYTKLPADPIKDDND